MAGYMWNGLDPAPVTKGHWFISWICQLLSDPLQNCGLLAENFFLNVTKLQLTGFVVKEYCPGRARLLHSLVISSGLYTFRILKFSLGKKKIV
jgi:hypothetical protein